MKKFENLILWVLFIVYEEMVFSVTVFGTMKSMVYVILFSIMFAAILNLLVTKNKKLNIFINYIIMIIIIAIFISQFIYYNIYEAIISFYSATNAMNQIWQFSDTIVEIALNRWYIIALFVLPILLLTIYYIINCNSSKGSHTVKEEQFKGLDLKEKLIGIIIALISQIIALVCIMNINVDKVYSNKNLYSNIHAPTISANNFGVLTTMRLDLQRLLLGFEEKNTLTTDEGTIVVKEKLNID